MKKENEKLTIQFVVALGLAVPAYFFGIPEDPDIRDFMLKAAAGLGIGLFISICHWITSNFKLIRFWVLTHLPWSLNRPIRVTVAYLIRIKVNGRYLLVPNSREIPGYQPVGGVFKFLQRENFDLFNQLGLTDDCSMPSDEISEHDLRLKMKQRKNLLSFIRWFKKRKDRELDPWREFYEELIKTEIISLRNFPHIQYKFVREVSELKYSIHHQILEYKHFEIYELQFASDAQKEEIKNLISSQSPKYLLATEGEIITRKSGKNQITDHTTNIL